MADQSNGGIVEALASGVLVSKRGHILTAGHAFDCTFKNKTGETIKHLFRDEKGDIKVSIEYPDAQERKVVLLEKESSEKHDIAILRLTAPPKNLQPASICRLPFIDPLTKLIGYGFPGNVYQPIPTLSGGLTDNGMWNVSAGFDYGMSGGAVALEGSEFVVGLIKGGVPGSTARSRVYPLYRAYTLLKNRGLDPSDSCIQKSKEVIALIDSEDISTFVPAIVAGAEPRPKEYFGGNAIKLELASNKRTVRREDLSCNGLAWVIERNGGQVLSRAANSELQYKYYENIPGDYAIHLQCYKDGGYKRVSNYVTYSITSRTNLIEIDKDQKHIFKMPDETEYSLTVGRVFKVHSYLYVWHDGIKHKLTLEDKGESNLYLKTENYDCNIKLEKIHETKQAGFFQLYCK